jgi:phage baseplate assembly protein W
MSTERERLFGNDLKLQDRFGGFDLIPDAFTDLDLAEDNDNIIQALQLRLRVRQGELAPLGWSNYGSRIHELIGEPNIPRTHTRLMAYARTAIARDPRVAEIRDISTQILPGERNVVRLQMEILLINQPNPLLMISDLNLEAT